MNGIKQDNHWTCLDYSSVYLLHQHKGIEWDKKSDTASWTMESLFHECTNLVLISRAQLREYLSPTFAPLCQPKE